MPESDHPTTMQYSRLGRYVGSLDLQGYEDKWMGEIGAASCLYPRPRESPAHPDRLWQFACHPVTIAPSGRDHPIPTYVEVTLLIAAAHEAGNPKQPQRTSH